MFRVAVLSHRTPRPIQFFIVLAELPYIEPTEIMINAKYVAILVKKFDVKSTVTLYDIQTIKTNTHSSFSFEVRLYICI